MRIPSIFTTMENRYDVYGEGCDLGFDVTGRDIVELSIEIGEEMNRTQGLLSISGNADFWRRSRDFVSFMPIELETKY
jgi:hypothetical protein